MNWETWLEALYHSKEICLVDYVMEQGWHERVLEEYQRLKEHHYRLYYEWDNWVNTLPTGFEEELQTLQRQMEQVRTTAGLLHSCLQRLYPPCPHCEGGTLPDYSNGPGSTGHGCNCYLGLDTTHKL